MGDLVQFILIYLLNDLFVQYYYIYIYNNTQHIYEVCEELSKEPFA